MNSANIKNFLENLQKWSGISVRNILIIAFILIFSLFFLIVVLLVKNDNYELLYSELSLEDSSNILKELEIRGFKYQLSSDSKAIKVPQEQIAQIRIYLSALGLPSTGSIIGYEIFDKEDGISITNFTQNIRYIRALEGELSRTISAFNKIKRARVHLVIPQKEIFSREKLDTKASVLLALKHKNQKLNDEEINSISHLIFTAVPAIEMKNITIVDDLGRSFKVSDNNSFVHTKQNFELKLQYEESIKENIEKLLANILGPEKVKATVNLDICFDKIVTNSEIYDPQNVVRSSQVIEEKDQMHDPSAADLSTANNILDNQNSESETNSIISEKIDKQTNYEISKTVKNHIKEPGYIQKMSIGILVDGEYDFNQETKILEYKPRSQDEINKIIDLVTASVGFSHERGDKIEIINMQFMQTDSNEDFNLSNWIITWVVENLSYLLRWFLISVTVITALILIKNLLKNILPTYFSGTSEFSESQASKLNASSNLQKVDESEAENEELKDSSTNVRDIFNDIVSKNPNKLASFIKDMLSRR